MMNLRLKFYFGTLVLIARLTYGQVPKEHVTCTRDYVQIGCFKSLDRLLPTLLVNDRDLNSKFSTGHLINWNDFLRSMHSLACRCSEKARALNMKYFGLRFYGECFGGSDILALHRQMQEEALSGQGETAHCINSDYTHCTGAETECAGTAKGEYIYELLEKSNAVINGGFSEWSDFGECSSQCYVGVETRERKCDSPEPSGEGAKDCSQLGPYTESRPCSIVPCDKPTFWSPWTECSKTCNTGFTMRIMGCNSTRIRCVGSESEVRECNTEDCSNLPVSGREWSLWSACSHSCGDGTRHRKRICSPEKMNEKICFDFEEQEETCHVKDCL